MFYRKDQGLEEGTLSPFRQATARAEQVQKGSDSGVLGTEYLGFRAFRFLGFSEFLGSLEGSLNVIYKGSTKGIFRGT